MRIRVILKRRFPARHVPSAEQNHPRDFAFGIAGGALRSPLGQRSTPRTNVLWGTCNFVVATGIAGGPIALNLHGNHSLIALLTGFWLMMPMSGTRIKRFLNDYTTDRAVLDLEWILGSIKHGSSAGLNPAE